MYFIEYSNQNIQNYYIDIYVELYILFMWKSLEHVLIKIMSLALNSTLGYI